MRQIGIKSGDADVDGQGGGRQRELKKKGWEMGLPDNHYERQVPALQHPGMVLGIQPPVDGRDQCVQRAQGFFLLYFYHYFHVPIRKDSVVHINVNVAFSSSTAGLQRVP